MATLTLNVPPVISRPAAAKPGFWRSLFDAMVDARMRQAEAEIARYRRVFEAESDPNAAYRVSVRDMGALPFVR